VTDQPAQRPDLLVDWIFPLVAMASEDPPRVRPVGTGFLLRGRDGLGLTARHVADDMVSSGAVALFRDNAGDWITKPVSLVARHPSDDLAVVQVQGVERDSGLFLSSASEGQTAHYSAWGYPLGIMHELPEEGIAKPRPDLVFSEGHIRRRVTDVSFPGLHGRKLYELSNVAGAGFSGAPICIRQPGRDVFEVIGVYIGESYSKSDRLSLAYAVRNDAALDVWPDLGC
jgi:Trypsin-like peptidase domain